MLLGIKLYAHEVNAAIDVASMNVKTIFALANVASIGRLMMAVSNSSFLSVPVSSMQTKDVVSSRSERNPDKIVAMAK
ncbi:hypothetical protein D3C85_1679580 [compost metagenome]